MRSVSNKRLRYKSTLKSHVGQGLTNKDMSRAAATYPIVEQARSRSSLYRK